MTDTKRQPAQSYLELADTDSDTAVSVILKLRGETCDIDCLYCFEKRKESPGGARIGVEDIARLTEMFAGRPVAVELHGGEPLTAGKPYIAELLGELREQPCVQRVTMQTNGIRLDSDWLDLFDEVYPQLRIGISLDGDPEANSWRVDYDGHETYPRVAAALERLALRGRKVGIITAVTPRVLGRAETVLDHIAGFEAVDAISFVPCFDSAITRATASTGRRASVSRLAQQAALSSTGPAWAISPDQYTEFVLTAAQHWVRSGIYKRVKLEPAVSTIRRLRGLTSGFCHFSNLKCDHVFTVYPDRRIGSCDELPWPAAELGRTDELTDISAAQRRLPLLQHGRALTGKCETCRYRTTCGGGCIATRLRQAAAAGTDDEYCRSRMRLIDGIAALITQPAEPSAMWCAHLRARPRQVNSMTDVAGFRARWRDPAATRAQPRLQTSAYGNVNTVGEPGVHDAEDLDPLDPAWRDAIEPGVWPLIDAITTAWDLITYDSCQGHRYAGLSIEPTERRVGILPRTPQEYASIAAALCRTITATELALPPTIRILAGRAELTCTRTGSRYPVLDLRIERAEDSDWSQYFADVDLATTTLAHHLATDAPDDRTSCGCPRTNSEVDAP
ncbi:radical SAM protein [Nocardia sp. NPDC006044]|uniref:radical SAM protein n=1 Tax=Nocardia sp. NPDC006044 TaxID=3364306 RepID=UPI003697949D